MDLSLTDGIKFGKEDLCKDTGDQIGDLQRGLDNTISLGKNAGLRSISSSVTNMLDDTNFIPTSDIGSKLSNITGSIDDKLGGISTLKDKVLSGEIVEGSNIDAQSIAECLSGMDLPSLPSGPGGSVGMGDMGKILEEAGNAIADGVGGLLSEALDPLENALSDALKGLKDSLDLPGLDKLLQLAQCMQDCPGASSGGVSTSLNQYKIWCVTEQKSYVVLSETPPGSNACPTDSGHYCDEDLVEVIQIGVLSPVAIEDKLSTVGLSITGDIDWESAALSSMGVPSNIQDSMNQVSEMQNGLNDKLAVAKDFSPVPEPPELPALPEIKSPPVTVTPPTVPNLPSVSVPKTPSVPEPPKVPVINYIGLNQFDVRPDADSYALYDTNNVQANVYISEVHDIVSTFNVVEPTISPSVEMKISLTFLSVMTYGSYDQYVETAVGVYITFRTSGTNVIFSPFPAPSQVFNSETLPSEEVNDSFITSEVIKAVKTAVRNTARSSFSEGKFKYLFEPFSEPSELPEIPKIENPINKLDVAQKLEALF